MLSTSSLIPYRSQAAVGSFFSCLTSFELLALMAKAGSQWRSGLESKDLNSFSVAEWSSGVTGKPTKAPLGPFLWQHRIPACLRNLLCPGWKRRLPPFAASDLMVS